MDRSDHHHNNNLQGCGVGVSESSMTSRDTASSNNGMYPPSLYDTSVSSKSSNSRRSPMMQHHQQQQNFSYPRSSSQPRYHQQPQQQQSTFTNDISSSSRRPVVTHLSRSSLDKRNEYARRYHLSSAARNDPGVAMTSHKPLLGEPNPAEVLAMQPHIVGPAMSSSNTSNASQNNNDTPNSYSLANTTTSSESTTGGMISGAGQTRQYRYNSLYHTNNGRSNETNNHSNASYRARATPDSHEHVNSLQQQLSSFGSNQNSNNNQNSADPHGMLTRSPSQSPSLRYDDTTTIRTTTTMVESMEKLAVNHHLANPHEHHHPHQPTDDDIYSSHRIETPSPVNVKELKRQLWNDQEVLQVPSSSSSQQYHYSHHHHKVHDYASDSENLPHGQQQQQTSLPSCHPPDLDEFQGNISTLRTTSTAASSPVAMSLSTPIATYPRFARSLSPARPRRQSPPPLLSHTQGKRKEVHLNPRIDPSPSFAATTSRQPPPTTLPYAANTVSDHTTSSGRFHSKFYEAALVARMGVKVMPISPNLQSSQSFSSLLGVNHTRRLPMDEQTQQQQKQNQPQSTSNTNKTYRSRSLAASNSNFHQDEKRFDERETKFYLDSNRPEIQHDEPTTRIYRASENQRALAANTSSIGKRIEPPLVHCQEGRGRVPSPLIQDRIRSLSQDSSAQKRDTIGFLQKTVAHTATKVTSAQSNPRLESSETTIRTNASSEEATRGILAGEALVDPIGREQSTKTSSRDEQMASYGDQPIASAPAASKNLNQFPSDEQENASSKASARLKMTKLMTKLNAVNRDNPEEALAEIDKILRQESHSSSPVCRRSDPGCDETPWQHDFAMTAPTPPTIPTHETAFINDGNDGDDDSDVSSLTNPTYQGSAKPYHERVRVISPQNEKTVPKRSSPTWSDGISPSKSLPFNPSMSSFRRPRPSQLQNYSSVPTATQDAEITEPLFVSRFEATEQESKTLPVFLGSKEVDSMLEDTFDKFVLPEPQPAPVQRQQIEKVGIERSAPVEQTFTRSSPSLPQDPPSKPTKDAVEAKILSRKLDKFITDKEALAKKIQVWDNLSNGMVSSKTERRKPETQGCSRTSQSLTSPHQPINKSRRHPWDSRFHTTKEDIKIRDTSMDEAIGIETEMTFRGDTDAIGAVTDRRNIESPQLSRSVDNLNNVEKHHFKRGRENIKERAKDYLPVDPVYHIDERVVEKKIADSDMLDFSDIPFTTSTSSEANEETQEDTKLMQNVRKSSEDEFKHIPQNQLYSQGSRSNPMHKGDVNEEDSPWVSMPPTSFFSEFKKTMNPFAETNLNHDPWQRAQAAPADQPSVFPVTEEKLKDFPSKHGKFNVKQSPIRQKAAQGISDGPPNRGPVDIDEYTFGISPIPSMDQSGEQAEIEVELTDPKKYVRTKTTGSVSLKNNGVATSRSVARSFACQNVENKEVAPREKKKGFLRAFIERKKNKTTGSATVGHATSATSVAGHSTSLDSRGAKRKPHVEALGQNTTFAPSTQSTPAIHLMPPPPGIMDQRPITPNRGRRGKIISDKITRAPSDSLERFRTPSMAQKFNRVMKLYDDET